ncbi:unannotated protein [freshwater metagenome]|uniref:Unannotated protein n=1 Tax=freshwater metagenome TaxID=449393 RepID=A0A6J6BLI9_9ZZZZ
MILIRSKEQYKDCSCQQKPQDEAFTVQRFSDLSSDQLGLFESSSNFVSSSAGIGSNQIPGSNSSSNVTGFGQIASVITGSGESGMSARSDSGERNVSSLLSGDFQSPLGVDALNVAQRDFNPVNQIVQNYTGFSDNHTGSPKQQETAVPKPEGNQQTFEGFSNSEFETTQDDGQRQNSAEGDGQVLAEAGLKFHTTKTLGGK